ncbi:ExbD/TolR family protein [Saccharophagus degradans]|uniref:Biopolymer transport protein ExbD/TolR n=1 Tax=Saccharophagus degradans (strain 2-40 / ATCC 43961 / DSM 17024) TaxID=203122 RepID=Q21GG6_SACD2|nr:biopolymer transporter ExbD [Saccharophagus degradans]ABD82213.1 conserved hypothetical protein [Saccharophagus degradans 2-40]
MKYKLANQDKEPADIDVTSFLNLMIVLVPVLLVSMTFTQITVLEISLPELTGGVVASDEPQSQLEVIIAEDGFKVFYPENTLIKEIPRVEAEGVSSYDYHTLSLVLQALKQELAEKEDVLLLSDPEVNYQELVATMEVVKSYKTTIAASLVEIELFPKISLDDAKKGKS